MKRTAIYFFLLLLPWIAGCSLAGDITPPPDYRPPAPETAQPTTNQEPLYPLNAPDPANGAVIYMEKCAPCHGPQGLGDGPLAAQIPYPVTAIGDPEVARQSIPSEWYAVVRDGNLERSMPPFESLSDSQRWDVLAYVYTLSVPAESLARGKERYLESCVGCHGENGQGDGPQVAGSPMPDFTDQASTAGKSTAFFYQAISSGIAPSMPAFAGQYSEQDLWALADYIRSLSFAPAVQPTGVASDPLEAELASGVPQPEATPVSTATADLAESQESGVVGGRVINGSGGEVPGGLEVTIHGFDAMQIVISGTVTVQPDGTFSLPQASMPPGRAFLATTMYGNVTYGSQVSTVQEGQDSLSLDITVYESTTDTSSLTVDRMHIFFDFSKPGFVQVIELYIISNLGDRTVVAKDPRGPVVDISLPAGATNLQFQDGVLGQRYLQTPTGFADTTPVRPGSGEHQILFAFEMPYDRKVEISQPLTFPVRDIVVLFPQNGVRLRSEMLRDEGTRDVQGVAYRMFSGDQGVAADTLTMTLSGRPGGDLGLSAEDRSGLAIGLGALGLALIAVGVLLYRRNQERRVEEEQQTGLTQKGIRDETPESLMDAIIALDDLYQEGQLPEEAYLTRRAELKERLREMQG